jgi:GNAT superfamily N-acetyltransferase
MHGAGEIRRAEADGWELQGRLRVTRGGGAARVPGARLMASGLAHAPWNGADVEDPAAADPAEIAAWYAARRLPYGLRLPAGADWEGPAVRRLRLMGRPLADGGPDRPAPVGVTLRVAGPGDRAAVGALDRAAFGPGPWPGSGADWLGPLLEGAPGARVALAERDGEAVGTGYALCTRGDAGPAVGVGGVAVTPTRRRAGVGTALTAWLLRWGADQGALLAHLQADDERAARLYRALGFFEVAGLDVHPGPPTG